MVGDHSAVGDFSMYDRHRLIKEFNDLFSEEAAQRPSRGGFSEETGEPMWVVMEAEAMLKRINEHRLVRGKTALTKERYERMETTCMGHSDYQSKLALYSAELVMEQD